jgi:hypothetical protein
MSRRSRREQNERYARPWTGPWRSYDIVKEGVIAVVVVAVLTVALAVVFGSPDEHAVTLERWATAAPSDFVATAVTELDGSSGTATYGAPYTYTPGAAQKIGPVSLQHIAGVTTPVNTAQDFVLGPLSSVPNDPTLQAALGRWNSATPGQQQAWTSAYETALGKAPGGDPAKIAAGDYGPVPVLMTRELSLAQTGALDGALLASSFYRTDYTKPLLFLADGSYFEDLARAQHLGGDQWGMMNETGRYPGQAWLWLYTFWYQVKPFSTSGNADALVWGVMALLSLGFVLLPFIPGLRSLPRHLGVHKLIWRDHYRAPWPGAEAPSGPERPATTTRPATPVPDR